MSATKPSLQVSPAEESDSPSDRVSLQSKERVNKRNGSELAPFEPTELATRENVRMETAMGDAILRFFRIRKGPKPDQYNLDAVATQPSIWDSENLEEYKKLYIHPKWENSEAFDPDFRWTFREENQVRRKVDWKIMVRFAF